MNKNLKMGMSPGKMIVYVWDDGSWCYGWDSVAVAALSRLNGEPKVVDLDNHLKMDLSTVEIFACLEAVNEAENRRSLKT